MASPGLTPDRADIIVAGLAVIDRMMRQFAVNLLQVHNRGVRDGLMLTMIDRNLGTGEPGPARSRRGHRAICATACSGELEHGRQVARLAGRIYSQMAKLVRPRSGRSNAARGGRAVAGRRLSDQLRSAPQAQLSPDTAQPAGRLSAARAGADRQRRPLPSRVEAKEEARQFPAAFGGGSAAGAAFGCRSYGWPVVWTAATRGR